MAEDLKISGLVEIITQLKGGDLSKQQMDDLERNAQKLGFRLRQDTSPAVKRLQQDAKDAGVALDKMGDDAKKAGTGISDLGKQIIGFIGAAAIVRFVGQSIKAFADWERQIGETRSEASRLGLDASAVEKQVRGLTTAIEAQTGILRQDTTPLFNKFLGLTGDVGQATLLLRAAVGGVAKQFGDLAQVGNIITGVMQGQIEQVSKLGISFDKTRGAAEQQAEVLEKIISKLLDLRETTDDTKTSIDEMKASMNDVKLTLGEQLAPAVAALSGFFGDFIAVVRAFGGIFGGMAINVVESVRSIGRVLAELDFTKLLTSPAEVFTNLADTAKRELAFLSGLVGDQLNQFRETIEGTVATTVQTETDALKALEGLKVAADVRAAAARHERQEKEAEDARVKAEQDAERIAEDRLNFERDLQERILQERIKLVEEGSEEELALQREILELMREQAVENAEATGADIELVNELFRLSAEALNTTTDKRREATLKAHQQRMKGFWTGYWQFLFAGHKEAWEQEKALQLQRQELGIAIANQAIALGRAAFGDRKAIAIAQAIVDTASGILRALADPGGPAGFALAALVAATGAVQIAHIASTNIGGGGGGGGGGGSFSAGQSLSAPGPATPAPQGDFAPSRATGGEASGGADTITFNFIGNNIVDRTSLRKLKKQLDTVNRGRVV